jgi:tetratricopeptide (TPR) repeat protein
MGLRMPRIVADHANRLSAVLALLVVVFPQVLGPARAQDVLPGEDGLSERLTDQILEMNKLDLARKLDAELDRRTREFYREPTVERANKLREMLKSRAATYESLEDFERAEVDYNALVDIKPISPTVYSDRGYFYMRQGRYGEAARDFVTGSRMAPAQSAFSYGVGRALSRLGNYSTAIDHYSEALRLAPRDSAPLLSRAEAYVQVGRYAEALADYNHALALGVRREGDRFFVYFGRGYANICVGDYEAAVRDMNVALSARPGMVNAVVWRGFAREKLGQREQALADYESALRSNPNDEWIRSSIKRVRS